MSEQAKDGIYVYQPYGIQDGADRWEAGRIYGVGGLPFMATVKGLTKPEAEAIVAALRSSLPSGEKEKDHNAGLAAAQAIPDVAGCLPASDRLRAVEAANVTLSTENAQLRQALRVIRKGLSEDADGEFWPARRWLDTRDIFHGDLNGNRVLELVAKHALHGNVSMPGIGHGLKTVEHLWNNGDFDGLIAFVRELLAAMSPTTEVSSAPAASPALKENSHSEIPSSTEDA